MRMGSYFVEIYATKISVFLYIPHHERADSGNAYRGMFGLKTHCFFKEKNCFRMSEFPGKFPELENSLASMSYFCCVSVCVFFSLCVFFCARARNFLGPDRALNKKKSVPTFSKILENFLTINVYNQAT